MERNWSPQQQEIFKWFEGKTYSKLNLVIRARAGTGKTTTVLEGANRAPECSIIMCAFNKSVATELQTRITNPNAEAKTLHSLGFSYVRRFWSNVRIVNGQERVNGHAKQIVETWAAENNGSAPDEMIKMVAKLATKGKEMAPMATDWSELMDLADEFDCVPDEEWEAYGWVVQRVCFFALKVMELACVKDGTIDFADMLFVPLRNRWVRGKYALVIVDEAQDMNASQIMLAQQSVTRCGRIAVVGDDRQAIYGFRGADSGSIDRLKKELGAVELGLTITYRCPKKVVELAQRLVPDYTAADSAPEGELLGYNEEQMMQAVRPGDFVLSRKNAPLAHICLGILKTGTRAMIQGREIGQGLIALVNKWKVTSMPQFLSRLAKWEEKETARAMAADRNVDAKVERIQDQADLLRVLAEGLSGVAELKARITSLFEDNGQPSVRCSSIHRAKGLEAETVYVLTDTFGMKSFSKTQPPAAVVAARAMEESNLRYVAYTRAKSRLVKVQGGAK
jgi:superfamily I DNA/RNA helicase